MFVQASPSENFLLHAETMQQVVGLLEDHQMIPSSLSISGSGWAEVTFITAAGQPTLHEVWQSLITEGQVELDEPMLEIAGGGHTILRVKFRIVTVQEQPEQPAPSRWQRLKRLVS